MQPEPSAVSHKEPTESNTLETSPSTQHGLDENHTADSVSPSVSDGADARTSTAAEQIEADAAFAASLQDGRDVVAQTQRRMSPSKSTPSPPAGVNRINEYEKASTPPTRKKEGPGFEVIKKYRSPSDKRSPIQELPNGTLRSNRLRWRIANDDQRY